MTVYIKFGRRRSKSWKSRAFEKLKGLMTFQENIWIIILQQMRAAAKKANKSQEDIKMHHYTFKEPEDQFYELEWFNLTIQGSKERELEELEEAQNMHKKFGKLFKKDINSDPRLSQTFRSKRVPLKIVRECYTKGYGSADNKNISNKLLEMGILTHISYVDDYGTRESVNLDD